MGQTLAARVSVWPSQLFGSVEGGVQPTASEAATWCKLFVRIAGTFAGSGTTLHYSSIRENSSSGVRKVVYNLGYFPSAWTENAVEITLLFVPLILRF